MIDVKKMENFFKLSNCKATSDYFNEHYKSRGDYEFNMFPDSDWGVVYVGYRKKGEYDHNVNDKYTWNYFLIISMYTDQYRIIIGNKQYSSYYDTTPIGERIGISSGELENFLASVHPMYSCEFIFNNIVIDYFSEIEKFCEKTLNIVKTAVCNDVNYNIDFSEL